MIIKKSAKLGVLLLVTLFVTLLFRIGLGEAQIKDAPPDVAAAIIVKVAGFEKKISDSEKGITIYVLGNPEVAAELEKGVGQPIGKSTLKSVEKGNSLPGSPPDILFTTDKSKVNAVLDYARANKVMSVTSIPDLVDKGIALGVGIGDDDKPKILLNLTGSGDEGLNWNPAVIKIAKTVK